MQEIAETGWLKEKQERANVDKILKKCEYPENLDERGMMHFLYLRACVFARVKPRGDFSGDARICADVLCGGGGLPEMVRAGASPAYVSCLSHYSLEADMQREIIDNHIPF